MDDQIIDLKLWKTLSAFQQNKKRFDYDSCFFCVAVFLEGPKKTSEIFKVLGLDMTECEV